jgi:hypothetical protein
MPNGRVQPQCRVCGAVTLNKCTTKARKPRCSLREAQANARRRCRLQRVLGGSLLSSEIPLQKDREVSPDLNHMGKVMLETMPAGLFLLPLYTEFNSEGTNTGI